MQIFPSLTGLASAHQHRNPRGGRPAFRELREEGLGRALSRLAQRQRTVAGVRVLGWQETQPGVPWGRVTLIHGAGGQKPLDPLRGRRDARVLLALGNRGVAAGLAAGPVMLHHHRAATVRFCCGLPGAGGGGGAQVERPRRLRQRQSE